MKMHSLRVLQQVILLHTPLRAGHGPGEARVAKSRVAQAHFSRVAGSKVAHFSRVAESRIAHFSRVAESQAAHFSRVAESLAAHFSRVAESAAIRESLISAGSPGRESRLRDSLRDSASPDQSPWPQTLCRYTSSHGAWIGVFALPTDCAREHPDSSLATASAIW